ncbi:hypothetical protein Tco_1543844 [Tanacetum coccineum]
MLQIEILHDVVGTSGYNCEVLWSFTVERIEQRKRVVRSSQVSVERASVLHQPDGDGSKRYHVVPYEELNGISIALVARFGVVSKSTDRILVTYGG